MDPSPGRAKEPALTRDAGLGTDMQRKYNPRARFPISLCGIVSPFQGLEFFAQWTQGGAALALGYNIAGFQP
jgi:hypothetical protein